VYKELVFFCKDWLIIKLKQLKMRKISWVFLFLLPVYAIAQKEVFDSIRNRLRIEINDSERVRMMVQLGNKIKLTDTAESWRLQRGIDSIGLLKNNEYFHAQGNFLKGTLLIGSSNFEAMAALEKAIMVFSKYVTNKRVQLSLGSAYINTGLVHFRNNDYATAAEYFLNAEQVYLKNNPASTDLAIIYSNLSMAYSTLNKTEDALQVSKKGLDLARKNNDKQNLANAMFTYGGNLIVAKKGDSGLAVLDSAKQLAKEVSNANVVYMSDFMKAMYYYNTKQYQKAIDYYSDCLKAARAIGMNVGIGSNYINIAACEAELKKPYAAAAHLDSSAKYLDYSYPSETKLQYFENYAEAYRQMKNYDKAFAYKDSVAVIKDSIYQADNIRQMEFRTARYNYESKQGEVEKLESDKKIQQLSIRQKNVLNYILAGSALGLIIISLLSYRNYRNKQKLQQQRIAELETEKKLTATEAVLKGEEQERTRLAKDLHDGLGGMLSGIKYSFQTMKGNLVMTPENHQAFERSMDMLDSSIKEMRRVAHNMMPEALVKFGLDTALKDFCNDINRAGALKLTYQSIGLETAVIDQTTAITIYRIVQELINNTMKHAAAKSAIVQVTKTDGNISITVEDDGKGFDPVILKTSRGIGWGNIQSRVEYLKGKLDVQSGAGKGTSVLIELKA
jgi:two-component system, NarL family, sensor kinase